MRVQSAEFIKKGSGATDSGPVKNELGAKALYLTVLSDGTPSLTVKVHTGNDPVNGTWFDSPINLLDGSVDDSISVAGLYKVPMGGVNYVKVVNASADSTMEVYGDFEV